MTNIYVQHQKTFSNVSAFVITKGKERVATIAFKFPRDGAGRLYCYLHIIGVPMVRGHANGYGYDKRSAAMVDAIAKVGRAASSDAGTSKTYSAFAKAAPKMDAGQWENCLSLAGFNVFQAV